MAKDENMLAKGGIQFFGQMSASATHEIKNTLAIINESAGLLQDLSMMAQKGHPLSPARINDISCMVTRHVHRADLILKKMNRFCHTVDKSTEVADLEKTACFILDMASRLIERQEASVEIIAPVSPMMVATNLFYLENIIWRAIETSCYAAKGEKKVIISFGNDSKAPSIWFSIDTINDNLVDDLLDSKKVRAIMAYLDISIEKNKKNNGFGLLWKKRLPPL